MKLDRETIENNGMMKTLGNGDLLEAYVSHIGWTLIRSDRCGVEWQGTFETFEELEAEAVAFDLDGWEVWAD